MGDICEDNLRASRSDEVSLCFASGELKEGCRAGIWCAPSSICYCSVPRSYLVERSDVGGHECMCDHAQHDHWEWARSTSGWWSSIWSSRTSSQLDEVPAEFAAFLAMHQEIRDAQVHTQLQNDLVEHLWTLKGNTAWFLNKLNCNLFEFLYE